ncbi:MAG: PadR family transcriptional regulator [Pseudonocardiaceae bacterium]|nr:PadR family transcriptional regulator [Pseudonocardiaceae bacterium]
MSDGKPPPLTPAGFQVLLALARGNAHGYAVMQFVDELSGGEIQLGPGTLYRTLARLVADGLVREVSADANEEPHDSRRRYYQLTPLGNRAAQREAEQLARLVDAADGAGLLPKRRSA